jgi:hypothetical protein
MGRKQIGNVYLDIRKYLGTDKAGRQIWKYVKSKRFEVKDVEGFVEFIHYKAEEFATLEKFKELDKKGGKKRWGELK